MSVTRRWFLETLRNIAGGAYAASCVDFPDDVIGHDIPEGVESVEVLDYSIDWKHWLQDGDKITFGRWTLPDEICELTAWSGIGKGQTMATVKVSGGVKGETYPLIHTIKTKHGLTGEATINYRPMA